MADGTAWDLAAVDHLGACGHPSRALATEPSACVEWATRCPATLDELEAKNLDWIEMG